LAQADQSPTDPPEVIYDPWDPDRVTLRATAILTVDRLREIAEDYAATRRRPTGVEWARSGKLAVGERGNLLLKPHQALHNAPSTTAPMSSCRRCLLL
jgi:hypothetical protein